MTFRDWFKREKFVLPSEEVQEEFVRKKEEILKTAKGSEKTKLTYKLSNQLMFLNQIKNKKKTKKPAKMNNKGKWEWVEEG